MSVPFPERWVALKSLLDADRPPLDPGLYVRPRRSCADDVAAELLGSPGVSPKFLLVGPRGGGKSTELRRIWQQVREHLLVAAIDLDRSGVNAGSVGAVDLCYLGGVVFLGRLSDEQLKESLFTRLKRTYAEDNRESAGALGSLAEALEGLAGFGAAASAASLAMGGVAGAGMVVSGGLGLLSRGIRLLSGRKGAVPETSPLGASMQGVLGDIAHAVRTEHGHRALCLFVDGLEKMNGEAGERFKELFQRTRLLSNAPWSAVFAAPPCTLTETFSVDGQGWSERVVWGFGPDDLEALARLLEIRFRTAEVNAPDHLGADTFQRWSEMSGGMPRHAVEMAHRAAELARRAGDSQLSAAMVEEVITWKGQALGRGLDQGHIDVLRAVLERGLLPKDERASTLFADGRILALPPDGTLRVQRFAVHPLLQEDVAALTVAGT
ncbi:MAG: hypothetical protein ABIO70_01820 [Pseudomonadota bacterium]